MVFDRPARLYCLFLIFLSSHVPTDLTQRIRAHTAVRNTLNTLHRARRRVRARVVPATTPALIQRDSSPFPTTSTASNASTRLALDTTRSRHDTTRSRHDSTRSRHDASSSTGLAIRRNSAHRGTRQRAANAARNLNSVSRSRAPAYSRAQYVCVSGQGMDVRERAIRGSLSV